ncbi:MAG: hypothetical protein ACXWC9_00830 [Pseudobdellovibrionaceae bacterium]
MGEQQFMELVEEHRRILACLQDVRVSWGAKDLSHFKQSAWVLNQEIEKHHRTEMTKLFHPMEHQKRLREGGPFCTYFFDFRMNFKPLNTVETDLRKQGPADFKIEIPSDLKSYFDANSPLTIPLEEHLAIAAWSQALERLPNVLSEAQTEWVDQVLPRLQDLIEANIQKEERCLFAFANQLLAG